MSQSFYLTQYGLLAEKHWREFRPKMVRDLERSGRLMEALTRQLEREQRLTPQQAETQAWEMIREKYILLPPEESLSL